MKKTLLFFAFWMAASLYGQTPILIGNPSFTSTAVLSSPCGSGCAYNTGPIPGWNLAGTGGSFQPGSYMPGMPMVAWLGGGTLSQTTSAILTPNAIYTLTVQIGQRTDNLQTTYSISLLAGSSSLATITGSNSSVAPGTLAAQTLTYTSGANPPSGNISVSISSGGNQLEVGNVQLFFVAANSPACPAPPHSAVIAWQPSTSAGVVGYNVYQNGTKITASPVASSPYTATGLTAGASIVFNVTAVNSSGKESAFTTLPTITVPTP